MSETLLYVGWFAIPIVLTLLFPTTSWALGRWYQGRLMRALEANEKENGLMFANSNHLSTASSMDLMASSSSTLLHVSICVGPSIGQMFFMWFKSLFGGRLHSYDTVLDFGRREVMLRLKQQADRQGCTSMQNIRLETSVISFAQNQDSKRAAVEFLAFATGLR